jgi:hypothetical protein
VDRILATNLGNNNDLVYAGGLVYALTGSVSNPSTQNVKSPFNMLLTSSYGGNSQSYSFAVDASLNRSYFMTDDSSIATPGQMTLEGFNHHPGSDLAGTVSLLESPRRSDDPMGFQWHCLRRRQRRGLAERHVDFGERDQSLTNGRLMLACPAGRPCPLLDFAAEIPAQSSRICSLREMAPYNAA